MNRIPTTHRKTLCTLAATALCLLPALLISIPAHAQGEVVPKEMTALFDDIADIDKLRMLNPLKLTAEQIDKMIVLIKKTQTEYNKKLSDAAVPPIRDLAKDIKDTRRRMLTARSGVPKDFDDKVKKAQADYVKRRDAEDAATLKYLSDKLKEMFTKEQQTTAIQAAKKYTEEDGKPTKKGTDDQFFNLYVLGTIVVYQRIVPLLEDMKKALTPAGDAPPIAAGAAPGNGSESRGRSLK